MPPPRKQPPTLGRATRPALLVAVGLLVAFAASACSTAPRAPAAPATDAPQDSTPPNERSSRWTKVKKTVTESARTPRGKKPSPPRRAMTLPELRDQLQAAGAQPTQRTDALPNEATLLEEAERVATQLAKRLAAGDLDGALLLTTSAEKTEACVSPGFLAILHGPLAARNENTLKGLVDARGGRRVEHAWTPGLLYVSEPKGTFRPGTLVLQQSELKLTADGVELSVAVDWLVWQDQGWSVFSISAR